MIKIRAKYDDLALGWVKGDVFEASTDGDFYDFEDKNRNFRYRVKDEFEIVANGHALPIRTVTITRQEIVPGQYGIVSVTNKGKIIIQPAVYTHEQLREAAHTLNQIAEALEDGAK